ncbi:hypothetical protein G7Y89_g4507 [Cudoniella acicularis]|uniref:Rhodopsin domain-containing protein n=1 Tax=Cudoniella acicularis TaxID=354080 RepID=A0A8H4W483_9HELO|nr:hypothetical protein G7Y89_g4507 [Cudoniella acicularis]
MSTELSPEFLSEDRSEEVIVTNSIFITLATITVILRFTARKVKKISWSADDYFILAAMSCVWVLYILTILCIKHGLGKHIEVVAKADVATFLELLYFEQIFYILSPPMIKFSLLFLYKRIFLSKRFLVVVHTLMAIVGVWTLIMLFMGIFNCYPISAFWTSEGKCFDFRNFAIGYAVVNITTDMIIWVLPVPMVWKLQLPMGQKVGLTLIFVLGLFDCAAATTRLITSMLSLDSKDPTFDFQPGFIWSIIEPSVGIMCACLPTVRVIIVAVVPKSWRKAFAFTSRTTKPQETENTAWPRSATYNEIHGKKKVMETDSQGSEVALELNDLEHPVDLRGITVQKGYKVEIQDISEEEIGTGV